MHLYLAMKRKVSQFQQKLPAKVCPAGGADVRNKMDNMR
jgi:hypothetical protein